MTDCKNITAIIVPPHRLAKYKEELDKAGLRYEVSQINEIMHTITICYDDKNLNDVLNAFQKVVAHFNAFPDELKN